MENDLLRFDSAGIVLLLQKPGCQKNVDLCPECYEKFCDFLDGAWKSIGMKPKEMVGTGELYPGEFESRHYDFEEDLE